MVQASQRNNPQRTENLILELDMRKKKLTIEEYSKGKILFPFYDIINEYRHWVFLGRFPKDIEKKYKKWFKNKLFKSFKNEAEKKTFLTGLDYGLDFSIFVLEDILNKVKIKVDVSADIRKLNKGFNILKDGSLKSLKSSGFSDRDIKFIELLRRIKYEFGSIEDVKNNFPNDIFRQVRKQLGKRKNISSLNVIELMMTIKEIDGLPYIDEVARRLKLSKEKVMEIYNLAKKQKKKIDIGTHDKGVFFVI